MIWIKLVVWGICGILAAGVATLVTLERKENKRLYNLVFVITILLLLGVSREFIMPQIQARYDSSTIDESLMANPLFASLKQHDSDTYIRITAKYKNAIAKGNSEAEANAAIRDDITMLVQSRLPHASNEAAVKDISVMVQELTELQQHGGDICYQLLFPQAGQPLDISKYLSKTTQQADLIALGEVVRTSAVAPQEIPKEEEVSALLEQVINVLSNKYGQDVALLQNPGAAGVDKTKICAITIEMYRQILQLPPEQGGKLLRYLFAQ